MCEDHAGGTRPTLSRRQLLRGSAGAAATLAVLQRMPRLALRSAARAVTADGSSAFSMAMHIHSSFSEQSASMDTHLHQATINAVDVVWWTDHDHRMDSLGYRDTVHFTSLTKEEGGAGQGGAWQWQARKSGPTASGTGGGIATNPCSPNDPVSGGSMHLTARSSSGTLAKFGYYANSHPAGWNYRDNLTGQTLTIDVLLTSGWSKGYLELLIGTSYHTAAGGVTAGDYQLSYRFVPAGHKATRTAQGRVGVVTVPVTSSAWTTSQLDPSADIAALWPAVDYRDFALWELTLSAASTGETVGGYFDYLRFDRSISGEAFLEQQQSMAAALASRYPAVVQQQGLELSKGLPHVNWFGGQVSVPDYATTQTGEWSTYLRNTLIPDVHSGGGLASYNHPYGYGFLGGPLPTAQQDALLQQVATEILPSGGSPAALGADLIEVGYNLRAGVDLAHHVGLWDVMSRNAVFLTGNGTTDDHFGNDWKGIYNNWVTSAWAASSGQSDLLAALAAGRAWSGSLSKYRGSLDMLVDGSVPMGAVSVSGVTSRQLVASATELPSGAKLQLLQGTVDYAGSSQPTPNTTVVASWTAAELAGGSVAQAVDTSEGSFLRTQVVESTGEVVAVSNPVWLLTAAPPGGIPTPRAA